MVILRVNCRGAFGLQKIIYYFLQKNTMAEAPDIQTSQSPTFKEINVTGQVSNLSYDGMKLIILNDSPDLQKALQGDQFKMSKAIINRKIECTLNISPINLKAMSRLFQLELTRYEKLFGTILSPEEVNEKFRNQS